ncbi:hypothetical protein BHE74_00036404 [Ensete ventricosum]|nr:hypothetical protein GW17_00048626 [Ensete ventricosum]RWW56852.1 hypothetical protein BHE74_00036404 [Ensete ventricosum]RZR93278.1 hypothetical protein BHM03_00021747 [Ensete ventricosum]
MECPAPLAATVTWLKEEAERKVRRSEMPMGDRGLRTAEGELKTSLPKSKDAAVSLVRRKSEEPKSTGLWKNLHGEQRARTRIRILTLVQNRANSMERKN